ncbi:MFS transporter [Geomicrobium sp. JCM 19038]|uniref:MFS transporter n=1 Tax=Geomicrobium sp. JCM 19038 TaxID=1460635 RepID=UPI00045F2542|nr:MFS transporter [Geomicrobium sp. JCM 19038]GAK09987.1 macrolide efflux protein [Geomicrobium sp. JCM 19038]
MHWNFVFLVAGRACHQSGFVLFIVALMHVIYIETASALFMSFIPVTITLARFGANLIAPLLFARFSLTTILIFATRTKVLLLVLVFACIFYDLLFLAYIIVFFVSMMDAWFDPSSQALVPRIIAKEERVRANSTISLVSEGVEFICWALGGLLLAYVHAPFLFLLVVLNAVFTAASCTFLHQRVNKTFANDCEPKSWHTEMRRGFSVMVSSRWLLHAVLASFLTSFASVVWIAAITYLFVEQVLMVSEGWWGFLNASLLIGLLLASLVLRTHHSLIQQNQSKTVFVGLVGTALFTLLFALTVEPFVALLIIACLGFFLQLEAVASQTLYQERIDVNVLPYVYAAEGTVAMLGFALGSLLVGFSADHLHLMFIYLISALLIVLASFLWFRAFKQEWQK